MTHQTLATVTLNQRERIELDCALPSQLSQNFLHILKVTKATHCEISYITLFIDVIETKGS